MTTRDMSDIAKPAYLWIALAKLTDKTHVEFLTFIEKRKDNPFNMLEWGDTMFKLAAEHQFYGKLAAIFEHVAQKLASGEAHTLDTEWTLENIRALVIKEFRYIQAVSRSTNQSHNLVNAYLCDIVREFAYDTSMFSYNWFRDAQKEDPEYQAWYREDAAQRRIEWKAKEEAATLAQKAKEATVREARRAVKRALKNGQKPSDLDLLTGYPNGARDPNIADWVIAAKHRARAERDHMGV